MSGSSGVSLSSVAAQVCHTAKVLHGSPVPLSLTRRGGGWAARVVVSGRTHRYPAKGRVACEREAAAGLLSVLAAEQSARIATEAMS